jgi:hypothetical protein
MIFGMIFRFWFWELFFLRGRARMTGDLSPYSELCYPSDGSLSWASPFWFLNKNTKYLLRFKVLGGVWRNEGLVVVELVIYCKGIMYCRPVLLAGNRLPVQNRRQEGTQRKLVPIGQSFDRSSSEMVVQPDSSTQKAKLTKPLPTWLNGCGYKLCYKRITPKDSLNERNSVRLFPHYFFCALVSKYIVESVIWVIRHQNRAK